MGKTIETRETFPCKVCGKKVQISQALWFLHNTQTCIKHYIQMVALIEAVGHLEAGDKFHDVN